MAKSKPDPFNLATVSKNTIKNSQMELGDTSVCIDLPRLWGKITITKDEEILYPVSLDKRANNAVKAMEGPRPPEADRARATESSNKDRGSVMKAEVETESKADKELQIKNLLCALADGLALPSSIKEKVHGYDLKVSQHALWPTISTGGLPPHPIP